MTELNIEEINRNLKGMRCPDVHCGGLIVKDKEQWRCSKCGVKLKDRPDYWKKVDFFQDQAVDRALHRLSNSCNIATV